MKLILIELKKLISMKVFLFSFIISVFLNFWLLIMSAENAEYHPSEFKAVFSELQDMNDVDKLNWLDNAYNFNLESEDYSAALLYKLRNECEEKMNYNMFLQNIKSQSSAVTKINLFGGKNNFNYRNILKTCKAYEKMHSVNPKFDISEGLILAMQNKFTNIFCILIVFLSIAGILRSEKEYSMSALLFSTVKGNKSIITVKFAVISIVSVFSSVVLYIENFFICDYIYGLGNLYRPLQSLEGFTASNIRINILQYMIAFIIYKSLVIYAIGVGLSFLSIKFKSTLKFYVIVSLIFIPELILYVFLDPLSFLGPLKYVNIFEYIFGNEIFRTYKNINVFGYPINLLYISIAVLFLIMISCSLLTYHYFTFEGYSLFEKNSIHISEKELKTKISIRKPIWYTFYKSLILQRGLFFTIGFILMIILFSSSFEKKTDYFDFCYQNYTNIISGEITDETMSYIYEEEQRFDNVFLQIENIENSVENSIYISNELNDLYAQKRPYSAFNYIKERVLKIQNIENTKIFYDTGYRRLFGINNYDDDIFYIMIVMLYCSIIISPLFSFDSANGMNIVIYTTYSGYKSYVRRNKFVSGIYSISAVLIWNVTYISLILNQYGCPEIHTSLKSISEFSNIRYDITIFQYILLIVFLRIFFVLVCTEVMCFISSKIKSVVISTIINTSFFVIPSLIYILGYKYMIDVGITPFLSVTRIVNKYFLYLN